MVGTTSRFGIYFFEFCKNICTREGDGAKRNMIRHSSNNWRNDIIISSENRGKKIVETISTINGISQNITIRIFN